MELKKRTFILQNQYLLDESDEDTHNSIDSMVQLITSKITNDAIAKEKAI